MRNSFFSTMSENAFPRHLVFVYGTLKYGEPNHKWLTDKNKGYSKFICQAETFRKYPLIIATKYNIPFLLDAKGHGHHVQGEVYEVDDAMLVNLDVLEDHPNFYMRRKEPVVTTVEDEGKETYLAWTYFLLSFNSKILDTSECLESYSNHNHLNRPYLESDGEEASLQDVFQEAESEPEPTST